MKKPYSRSAASSGHRSPGRSPGADRAARPVLEAWLGSALLVLGSLAAFPLAAQDIYLDSLGHDYGSADAPVQVVELSDFGCHYCQKFHQETFPTVLREYIESGKVRWKYVTFVSGMFPNSKEASVVAECVGEQGLFDEIRDRLFEAQREWKRADDVHALLLAYAAEVGADVDEVGRCLAAGRGDDTVSRGTRFGFASGARGTPTFLVDGFPMMGALPIDFIREVLDRRLEAAANQGTGGH